MRIECETCGTVWHRHEKWEDGLYGKDRCPACPAITHPRARKITKRKQPYTKQGLLKVSCTICAQKAKYQWKVCADDRYFPVCARCDGELNFKVLQHLKVAAPASLVTNYMRREKAKNHKP